MVELFIGGRNIYDYIADCLKTGSLYFGTIQARFGLNFSRIMIKEGFSMPDWSLEFWRRGRIGLKRRRQSQSQLWHPETCLTLALTR